MTARTHHAYAVEADAERFDEVVSAAADFLGLTVQGNPDVSVTRAEMLGIDESRALAERVQRRPVAGNLSVFIVCALGMTTEAQQALLKTIEEPPPYAVFLVAVPSLSMLLPTLRSRLERIDILGSAPSHSRPPNANTFLSMRTVERIERVAPIISTKDKRAALALISGLERALAARASRNGALVHELARSARELAMSRGYLLGRSPSIKLILEHLAITLPTVEVKTPPV